MRYQTFATFSMLNTLPVQPSLEMREIAFQNKVQSSIAFLVACRAHLVRLAPLGDVHKFEGCL